MRLSVRLLIFAFVIVLFVSVASLFIFYSLTSKLLTDRQTQDVLNSANDFVFAFQNSIEKVDEDFHKIYTAAQSINKLNLDSTSIDFVFALINDSLIDKKNFQVKKSAYLNISVNTISQFFNQNQSAVLRYQQIPKGNIVYYGKIINSIFLDELSQKIRAEIALLNNNIPVELSHENKTQNYLLGIIEAAKYLKYKNNFDLYTNELENVDLAATFYNPKLLLTPGAKISFIIFKPFEAVVQLKATLRMVMIIIVLTGSALTFIFLLLFTVKLRKQISLIGEVVSLTSKGEFDSRVKVISKDEIGRLGAAFNKMLDEISRSKKIEKDYSDFITLINQNPTLKEISDATLSKIIKTSGLTFGALYVLEGKELNLAASFGVGKEVFDQKKIVDFYNNVVENKEPLEFKFNDNFPEVRTGIAVIKIKYLLVYPIVYNKRVIAVLELASDSEPANNIKEYIVSIQEQLAIGLTNAIALKQLEDLVNKLKKLNEEYQKQNEQISEQNEQLKILHNQLKEKADELDVQRKNALELTKVKSQFLASMSHELKTPLISVLGLTELMLKDELLTSKTKERLNIILRNGKRLLTLINNILDFSRLESGKIEVKKETFLLSDLIEEVEISVENLALEKKLEYIVQLPREYDLLINTDKFKLEQVLINLLTNAVKFTEKGFVKLKVELSENDSIIFSVEDSGIGISEANLQNIFDEFKQADSGISRKYGGVGLGLTICKKYIELMGSNLNVKSKVNEGSSFYFKLDDVLVDKIVKVNEKFLKAEIIKDTEQTSQLEIVIINHNKEISKLISDYLNSYNFRTYVFSSFNDGVLSSAKLQPHTIVMETAVNDGNCWNAIVNLKKSPLTEKANIIIISILEKEKVGWAFNADEYLISPVELNKFKSAIESYENLTQKKVKEIWSLIENENELILIRNFLGEKCKLVNFESEKNLLERIDSCTADMFLFDLIYKSNSIFSLFLKIEQKRTIRDIPKLIKINELITPQNVKELNESFNKVASKTKNHPLDILKVIRDKVGIKEEQVEKRVMHELASLRKNKNETYENAFEQRPKVLVVDDDRDTLFTIGEILKELNYDVIFAHDGLECLLILNHTEPDLILLDIMMPQMDGFETIKRIKTDHKEKNFPIIALTAYAMLDNKNVIEKNGFNDLITKPIDTGILAQKVRKYINVKVKQL
ncbi:response regulator [Melioribacteraceae bacterium 4301-Me]|uniref:response regulator n=1 Tax=Pyranulibacter aquaticus TaxID=3163344 RepID=UPI003595AE4E